MRYSEIRCMPGHEKVGHRREVLNAGLKIDVNLLYLDGEYFLLGKMDTYLLLRNNNKSLPEENGWTLTGIFPKDFLKSKKIPNNIGMVVRTQQEYDENIDAQLFIQSEEGFIGLIKLMASEYLLNTKPEQTKIVFYEDRE